VIVQLDLVGLDADHVADLRSRLHRAFGLEPHAILFHCTHTHNGPATMTWFGPGRLTPWLRGRLTKAVIETVAEALEAARPVTSARWFEEPCAGIAFNRDEPGGPVDARVRGAVLEVRDGPPVVILGYACHPVVLGVIDEYSPDYPGVVDALLEAEGYRCVFLTAPCGDLNPLNRRAGLRWPGERAMAVYGARISEAVMRGMRRGAEIDPSAGIRAGSRLIDLPVRPPARAACEEAVLRAEQALEADPTDGPALTRLEGNRRWLAMLEQVGQLEAQPVEAQGVVVGDTVVAGVGAELFSELALAIRAECGLPRLLLAGTCNGVRCYIATRRSVERDRYAVQASCFYGVFPQQPGGGERFAREVAGFLSGLGPEAEGRS
jgi:hypothetical protein